jgi:hypothetical protein
MRLGVEHVSVQRHKLAAAEDQVEVLESLCQEETLLKVIVNGRERANVLDAAVSVRDAAVGFDRLEGLPGPGAVPEGQGINMNQEASRAGVKNWRINKRAERKQRT